MANMREVMAAGVAAPLARMLGNNRLTSVIAGGSSASDATPLIANYCLIQTTGAGQGVVLMSATGSALTALRNLGPAAVNVYPEEEDAINEMGPGLPVTLGAGQTMLAVPSVDHWIGLIPPDVTAFGVPEAPSDNTTYGRRNVAWNPVLPLAGGTMTGALILSGNPVTALGAATKGYIDGMVAGLAPLLSPVFTGNPVGPTPLASDNSVSLATTAFVKAQNYLNSGQVAATYAPINSPLFTGNPRGPTPLTADSSTSLATTAYVQAQGYQTAGQISATYAPINSPVFTGNPQGPTPAAADSSVSLATTAFVKAQNYQTAAQIAALYAPIASPGLTGSPTAPTPAPGNSSALLATTAFVGAAISAAATIPAGGSAGQPLVKNSSSAGAYSWGDTNGVIVGAPAGAALGAGQLNIQNTLVVNNNASALPITNVGNTRQAQFIGADATSARVIIDSFGAGVFSTLAPRSARGTGAAPTALQSGDGIGFIGFNGYCASGFALNASISANAAETFSSGHQGSVIHFNVTPVGSATMANNSMTIGGGGGGIQIGSPSVGDPGAGSLAVSGVIWNNSIAGGTNGNINIGTGTTGNLATLNFYANQVTVEGGNLTVQGNITSTNDIVLGGTLRNSGSSLAIGGMSGNIANIGLYGNQVTVQGGTLTVAYAVNVGADLVLSRTDQSTGYVVRPNVSGLKIMTFAVQGSGPLDELHINAATAYTSNDLRCTGWVYSPNFSQTSDRATKRGIRDVPGPCLPLVQAIQPRIYDLDRIPESEAGAHWGFIADEIETAMAAAGYDFGGLTRDENTGLQALAYHELTAVLWQAVRELQAKLEAVSLA